MNQTERQHYVPRFLLKNFTSEKQDHVFVFDKKEEKSFKTNVNNIAVEKNFYDIKIKGYNLTIEPSLAELENYAADVIKKIISSESLSSLKNKDYSILSLFIAVQYLRTYYLRINMSRMNKKLEKHLESMGVKPENVENFEQINEEDLKKHTVSMIINYSHEFSKLILEKEWILTKTDFSNPFIISDHPVTLANQYDHSPYGNIGFAVKGIEIYIPISDTLSIFLMCPSLARMIRKSKKQLEEIKKNNSFTINESTKNFKPLLNLYQALENNEILFSYPENVKYKNHLQIAYSNRWVFSSNGKFDLVKEMLEDNPDLKFGPSMGPS